MSRVVFDNMTTADDVGIGDSGDDRMALGYPLTLGSIFPYTAGGFVLRRRRLYPTPETHWQFCGFARPADLTIDSNDGVIHEANQAYHYSAARALGNGFISAWSNPVRVDFDANIALITPGLPAWPVQPVAIPISNGAFEIIFEYDPYGQASFPATFQVFEGPDAASINYGAALVDAVTGLDSISYRSLIKRYSFHSQSYAGGTSHVFGVRSRNSNQIAEQNTFATSSVVARVTAPAAATIKRVSVN